MTGTTPSEAWLSSTRRRPSLAGIGAATGMPLASSQVVRAAVSARRWNRFGETDDFAIRRLSPDVTHASRFPELMTRRWQVIDCDRRRVPKGLPDPVDRGSSTGEPEALDQGIFGVNRLPQQRAAWPSRSKVNRNVAVKSSLELFETPCAYRDGRRGSSKPQFRNNWPNLACLNGQNVSLVTIATGRCRLYSPQGRPEKAASSPSAAATCSALHKQALQWRVEYGEQHQDQGERAHAWREREP